MKWLNGWHIYNDYVLVGTESRCAGCGERRGLACVIITGREPSVDPDWPFTPEKCPVCFLAKQLRGIWESTPMTPRASELFKKVRELERKIAELEVVDNNPNKT